MTDTLTTAPEEVIITAITNTTELLFKKFVVLRLTYLKIDGLFSKTTSITHPSLDAEFVHTKAQGTRLEL